MNYFVRDIILHEFVLFVKNEMYKPQVDDYVKWNCEYTPIEGWVYFVDNEYITIEVGVKDKPDDLVHFHKKTHCCVLCFHQNWHELEYVKNRRNDQLLQEDTISDTFVSGKYS